MDGVFQGQAQRDAGIGGLCCDMLARVGIQGWDLGGIPSIVAVSSRTDVSSGRVVTGGYGWVAEQPEGGSRGTLGA